MSLDSVMNGLFWTIGVIVFLWACSWLKGLIDAKRQKKVLEIDLALKNIKSNNDKLSLDELVLRANERDKPGDSSDTP